MVCSVVGMSNFPPELSINPTNSTNSTNSTVPDSYDPFHYFGVWGSRSWQCESFYNKALEATSEFDKWGSSSASAIMALLPTLIAITSAVTANIGFICHLSPTQGLIAAALTFGFPVRQINTWKSVTISVRDPLELHHEDATTLDRVEKILTQIKKLALNPHGQRLIWVLLFRFLFSSAQGILIWCLLIAVPKIDSFNLMWLCPAWGDTVFILWMGATFTVLGWVRAKFESDSFGRDEVIYMSNAVTARTTGRPYRRLLDPYPVIVILRLSSNGQANRQHIPHFIDYLIGMSQILWICLLSFLFSSTIGGTLFRTLLMVVTFITLVFVSRGLSILACVVAQKHLNIRVIEYDNLREKKMLQILLGGLTGVTMDIRWVNYKKSQWKESVKMYQWGYKLSHGNVMEGRCKIHTPMQTFGDLMTLLGRLAGIGLFYELGFILGSIWIMGYYSNTSESIPVGPSTAGFGSTILVVAGMAASVDLWRTKKFLICDCN